MDAWLKDIQPYTKTIKVNHTDKTILLVHPHFKTGTISYRKFLKLLLSNKYKGYTVTCIGFASIKGYVILEHIKQFLERHLNAKCKLSTCIDVGTYELECKFKG